MKILTQENFSYIWQKISRVLGEKANANTVPNRYIADGNAIKFQYVVTAEDGTETVTDLASVDMSELIKANLVQADWDQSDESASDYIKNRTHYTVKSDVLFDDDITLEMLDYRGTYTFPTPISLVTGKTYEVVFGDYTTSFTVTESGANAWNDHNMNWMVSSDGISIEYSENTEGHLFIGTPSTIKQLDEQFIPDTIARSSQIGDLENLHTSDKTSVVVAINEIADKIIFVNITRNEDNALVPDKSFLEIEALSNSDCTIFTEYGGRRYMFVGTSLEYEDGLRYANFQSVDRSIFIIQSIRIYEDNSVRHVEVQPPEIYQKLYDTNIYNKTKYVVGAINDIDERLEQTTAELTTTKDSVDELKLDVADCEYKVGIQSDFGLNDETAIGYIKNRTHWVSGGSELILDLSHAPVSTGISVGTGYVEETEYAYMIMYVSDNEVLTAGNTYTVIMDNYESTDISVTANLPGFGDSICIGNQDMISNPDIDTSNTTPFCIASTSAMGMNILMVACKKECVNWVDTIRLPNIQLYCVSEAEYHPLDDRFIPESIARVSDIVQADWDQSDETASDYVKNRPIYSTQEWVNVVDTTDMTLGTDVDIERSESSMDDGVNADYILYIQDVSFNIVEGDNYKISINGVTYDCVVEMVPAGRYHALGLIYRNEETQSEICVKSIIGEIWINEEFLPEDYDYTTTVPEVVVTHNAVIYKTLDRVYVPYLPGKTVEGETYTIDETEVVAERGAEIFNDLESNIAAGYCSHAEGSGTTASAIVSHAEGSGTTASAIASHAEGDATTASGGYSHAEGYYATASGGYSHAEGYNTTASADGSHAEGNYTTASGGDSHAEGHITTASADGSHAEGYTTTASALASHAEGNNTTASGNISHAEGDNTTASGHTSHAEGTNTTASADESHAEGHYTIAASWRQHVQGTYNIADENGIYAHIVGNGTGEYDAEIGEFHRSNAHTLDWSGNAWYSGNVRVGGTSYDDAGTLMVAPSTAVVGQFIAVKAVDDNGLPTEFEAIDTVTNEDIDAIFGF